MSENNEQPSKTSLLDEKIKDAREDVEKAQAKLDRLLIELANRERSEGLAVGTVVKFEYGRGDKRRTLEGTIIAAGDDEKLGKQFAVQAGEGLDIATYKIRAADVLFDEAGE